MGKLAWTLWHEVVKLREDLKTGELSLAVFAADLYDVVMGKARPVYQEPREFFALTYPTFNLRELAKDVVRRLAGKSDKAIRQLELTYGGGKTHTLITLYHLVNNPASLPQLPAVDEFVTHIGMRPPCARVAVLSFDKLDVEKGMEVRGPEGETRWIKHPWSVIAFQIAGADGLRLLNAEGKDEERASAPAENLLVELLSLPGKQDLSTLILIDEVLMYVREKVGFDPAWRSRIVNFFQYLTQAVTKVDRCAMVASLLATDPGKSDTLGKEITSELYAIFRREREEGVQPVVKEDVAEVLRRRFFTPDSIRDRESFRPHVVAALKGIAELDEQTRKDGQSAEERFLKSYPFHPDLTDIFYTKWTNLEGFQRTRGVLRTFALALRGAEKWDECPLIAANVFLSEPGKSELSEAARELTNIATTEEYEGKRQEWTSILQGELAKAREIEQETSGMKWREIEQAVFATFLHSQPIGQKALARDLFLLLSATRPDRIDLEKALRRWTEVSWFLDEGEINSGETGANGQKTLPKAWRLGSKPNLKQMHHDACLRVGPELVQHKLIEEIGKLKSLTSGAAAAGAKVHTLPNSPRDIEDDGEFHYAVLRPNAASDSGKPGAEAKRFLDETTNSDRPRVHRNAVVLAAPSRDGLDAARNRIREYLGWEEVREQLRNQEVDPLRVSTLSVNLDEARKKVPEAIKQAYCIVVTVSDKNEAQAFKLTVEGSSLFEQIKADSRSRISDVAINAEALLPDGPYDFWRAGETSRRVKDLVGAFAQFAHLPKMLNRKAILDTLVQGCVGGRFVLQLARADHSVKTFWRQAPDDVSLKEPSLEVVLPEAAALSNVPITLLAPGMLPGLWEKPEITVREVKKYFSGNHVVKIKREGYDEPITIPKAEAAAIDEAVSAAVKEGKLWLTAGTASLLAEEVPPGLVTDDVVLQAPPASIPPLELLPDNLLHAWNDGVATASAIATALSANAGKTLPWSVVRDALDGAFRARLLARESDGTGWPCAYADAHHIKVRVPAITPPQPVGFPDPIPATTSKSVRIGQAELKSNEIQDLAEVVHEIVSAAAGYDLKFVVRVELGGDNPAPEDVVERVNAILEGISGEIQLR